MLNLSVSHIPGTVDACPLDGVMHLRFRVQRGLLKGARLIYNCNKNLWHQFRDEVPMELTHTDSELEYYSTAVPITDTRFAYIFALECVDGVTRYLSEEGLSSQYDHDLGYFSFFQYASQFPCDMMRVPEWVNTAVCYPNQSPIDFSIGEYAPAEPIVERAAPAPHKPSPTIQRPAAPISKRGQAKQRIKDNKAAGVACCPKCGSTSLSANKKGFSAGKAAAGMFLTGGLAGAVAGGIGANKVEVTCLSCGHKFRP